MSKAIELADLIEASCDNNSAVAEAMRELRRLAAERDELAAKLADESKARKKAMERMALLRSNRPAPPAVPDSDLLQLSAMAIQALCGQKTLLEPIYIAMGLREALRPYLSEQGMILATDATNAAVAAFNAGLSAPQPVQRAVPDAPFAFDRYINGVKMAEGVVIQKQLNLTDAMRAAAKLAVGPGTEIPVLILRTSAAPQPAQEVQSPPYFTEAMLRAGLNAMGFNSPLTTKRMREVVDAMLAAAPQENDK